MTSIQLSVSSQGDTHSSIRQNAQRSLKTRWHYGRAYMVIAAIAPFVLLSLFLVHIHTLALELLNTLTRWLNTKW